MPIQNWGGGEFVSTFKLWSRVAISFHAPPTMTNRSSKMAQLWRDYEFEMLVGPKAAAAGVEQPEQNEGQPKKRVHNILTRWPGCLQVFPEKRRRTDGHADLAGAPLNSGPSVQCATAHASRNVACTLPVHAGCFACRLRMSVTSVSN